MRVAIVGPSPPWRGGIALHTAGLAAAARERSHEVLVISFRRLYPDFLFPGTSQLEPGSAPPSPTDRDARPLLDPLDPRSWRAAAAEIVRFRPQVVALQRWHPFFQPALAAVARSARRAGARVAWMVHNARPHESVPIPGFVAALGMQASDRFLVHAASEVPRLRALGVSGTVVVRGMPVLGGAVELRDPGAARRKLRIPPEEVVFLFLGYVRPYKGVDLLLESLARLDAGGKPWRAVIAGEWYVDRARADAKICGPPLSGRVEVLDRFIPGDELADLFAAATAVVLPYRAGTQSGVIPLAWAHGRPVVTTAVGGLPDVVEEGVTGLVVPPGDVTALCAALEQVRSGRRFDPDRIASAAGRTSWGDLVEELVR